MPKPKRNQLLDRGVWFLVVGVFTSWLLGLGLLFILAAAVCGFVGLFRERIWQSALLLVSALVCGFFCAHIAALVGVYAYSRIHDSEAAAATHPPAPKNRK
jgi:MFS family permease